MDKLVKNAPMILFCLYAGKMLLKGGTYTDAPAMAILALLAGYVFVKAEAEEQKKIKNELSDIKKQIEKLSKDNDDIKTHVSGLKLSQSVRGLNVKS